jgi:hypothetical protein
VRAAHEQPDQVVASVIGVNPFSNQLPHMVHVLGMCGLTSLDTPVTRDAAPAHLHCGTVWAAVLRVCDSMLIEFCVAEVCVLCACVMLKLCEMCCRCDYGCVAGLLRVQHVSNPTTCCGVGGSALNGWACIQ